jgi:hypothetical protein
VRLTSVLFLLCLWVVPTAAYAQDDVAIRIDRRARLTVDGGIVFRAHVACGPLAGTEDFRESVAGAAQTKTGAEAEGGLSPDVVCDGIERSYTAQLSAFTDAGFRRGPAAATVTVQACNTVGDGQVCISGSHTRRVVIAGPLVDGSPSVG